MSIEEVLQKNIGYIGRMISGSKSLYRMKNPDNIVLFNANIIVDGKKVWDGDLDITLDSKLLQKSADDIQKSIYILSEMDARFENENLSEEEFKQRAKYVFSPQLKIKM